MIDTAIQVTPVTAPLVQWAVIRPGGSAGPPAKRYMAPTSFKQPRENEEFDLFARRAHATTSTPATDLLAVGERPTRRATKGKPILADRSKIEDVAEQRVRLLAAKYAGGPNTREIVARLAILNGRLLEMEPRVTVGQVAALENIGDKIAAIRSKMLDREARLGLST